MENTDEKYESKLNPGTFVWVFFAYRDLIGMGNNWTPMYQFRCADGSLGAMDQNTFHEFYRKVGSE